MTIPEAQDSKWSILNKALHSSQTGIIVTDPSLPDNPIIYLNQGFSLMTGYKEEEVLGKIAVFYKALLQTRTTLMKFAALSAAISQSLLRL